MPIDQEVTFSTQLACSMQDFAIGKLGAEQIFDFKMKVEKLRPQFRKEKVAQLIAAPHAGELRVRKSVVCLMDNCYLLIIETLGLKIHCSAVNKAVKLAEIKRGIEYNPKIKT